MEKIINKLPPKTLKELYCDQKMSSPEIARIYHYDARAIGELLKKHNIKARTLSEAANLRFNINIPKKELEKFYLEKKFSSFEIAKIYKCSHTTIRSRLKECGIKIRTVSEAKRLLFGINITKKELKRLYVGEKMSSPEIAKIYRCDQTTIRRRLKEYGIKIRTAKEATENHHGVTIAEKKLKRLYLDERKNSAEIAKIFKCCQATICNKLREYKIPIRDRDEAMTLVPPRYARRSFDGRIEDKSYLMGFRIGDLTVECQNEKYASTIYIRASSTKPEFIQLVRRLFLPYGHVWTGEKNLSTGNITVKCFLNKSFDFLLPKKDCIYPWVLKNKKYFAAFLAGYADAEGCFHLVDHGKSSAMAIASGDKNILFQIFYKLNELGILCRPPRLRRKKGTKDSEGTMANKDIWVLAVGSKKSLLSIMELIEPHLKHSDRRKRMQIVKKNILWRNERYNNLRGARWDKLYLEEGIKI